MICSTVLKLGRLRELNVNAHLFTAFPLVRQLDLGKLQYENDF